MLFQELGALLKMVEINDWVDLKELCPVNLSRVHKYYQEFHSSLPSKISLEKLNKDKQNLFTARVNLDSVFISLMQLLYNREILEKKEDKVLYALLVDNVQRYLAKLDEKEFDLLIKHDSPNKEDNNVGISRVSAYHKILEGSVDSLIYESLVKSTLEYSELEKEQKEKRKFLYIFFQIFNVTMLLMGGITREGNKNSKTGMIKSVPTTWQGMMSDKGGEYIKKSYKEDTGIDVDEFDEMTEEYFEEPGETNDGNVKELME